MKEYNVLQDIAERTGGSVYVGVVGPMRTGKSTFIKRFMDLLVMPNIRDTYDKQRARDELPQSGAGKTVMTTQPKFVPDDPVDIAMDGNMRVKVRLVDCVGYVVPGAKGVEEDGQPRMVRTPWMDEEIPFHQAAEIGTRKVITDHSTIGVVVVTDGSIVDIPRVDYIEPEERVIRELQELGKPFVVVLNSTHPHAAETQNLARELEERYGVAVMALDALNMSQEDALNVLREVLHEFPLREISFRFPKWVEALDHGHWLRHRFIEAVFAAVDHIHRVRDVDRAVGVLDGNTEIQTVTLAGMELGSGAAVIELEAHKDLFYKILSEMTGHEIQGDHQLVGLMTELSFAKREYDKVSAALASVRATGYGIVPPTLDEIEFNDPEVMRQGHRFGVKLKASAPSIHMVRADINTEVTPFVGTEQQGEEFIRYLSEELDNDPAKVWNSEFLGRSLQDIVREGIQSKLYRLPDNAQEKLQETLSKIINEGSGGLICIIL